MRAAGDDAAPPVHTPPPRAETTRSGIAQGERAAVIVLSLVVWTWALGPMGAILGVPLTMVLYRMYHNYSEAAQVSAPALSKAA